MGEIMLYCHSERSIGCTTRGIGCLQILRSAKNAELRMTKSPSIFEEILFCIAQNDMSAIYKSGKTINYA
jgi:hypothetical protein